MESSKKVFIQPRHSYASAEGRGHIHLSAPMITAMARLHAAGVRDILFQDENFDAVDKEIDADIVGINLVGAPYIPKAIEMIRGRVREGSIVLLGGQIVDSLDNSGDFERLFWNIKENVTVLNGNRKENLEGVFGSQELPEQEEVSSIPIWEGINDEKMKAYLEHEISIYLSQGCKHACTYCQALKNKDEKYRDLNMASADLEWLTEKAISFGIDHLDIYFSNLDFFQTPAKLKEFAEEVIKMKEKYGFTYNFRALSTLESFLEADSSLVQLLKKAGLSAIGFGIDGATPEAWRMTGKMHNLSKKDEDAAKKCVDAVRITVENGITPEILMVFGHDLKNLEKSRSDLEHSLQFSKDMVEQFGAVIRPHVVKNLVPGAIEWKKRTSNATEIEMLLSHPEYFQALDYTALPSEITHPDATFRDLVEEYYRAVCALSPERSTKIVYPNTPEFQRRANSMGTTVEKLNEGQFDR